MKLEKAKEIIKRNIACDWIKIASDKAVEDQEYIKLAEKIESVNKVNNNRTKKES